MRNIFTTIALLAVTMMTHGQKFWPQKGEVEVCVDTKLRLTFSEPVERGVSGMIRVIDCDTLTAAVYLLAAVLLSAFWLRLTLHGDMFGRDLPTFVTLWLFTLLLCFSRLQGVIKRGAL